MAIRSAVYDEWVKQSISDNPDVVVLHIGCGMDSRIHRVGNHREVSLESKEQDSFNSKQYWYDIDFEDVIKERKKYYEETDFYHMIASDARNTAYLSDISGTEAIVVMEGVSMYLEPEALESLLQRLCEQFSSVYLLMDCYSTFAAKMSKYKNPINEVGVTNVYGLDDPASLAGNAGYRFLREHSMAPTTMIRQLKTGERILFSNLYAGKTARKLYRMYELEA